MARSRHNSPEEDDADDGASRIFTIGDRPVFFYLYGTNEPTAPGALTEGQHEHMKGLITQNGGFICKSEADADTIIVTAVGLAALKEKYDFERDTYVEMPSFVALCIRRGVYMHDKVVKKPLGGRPPKSARTPFTDEDDLHLCEFLARRIPDKKAGGRTGNITYQELTAKAEHVDLPYQWAARHSWQSWRERYKKNSARLDPMIQAIVDKNPPPEDGKGVRQYDRRVNGQGQFALLNKQALMEEEEEEDEDEDEDVFEIETGHEHNAHEEAGESQQESSQERDEEDHRPGPEDAGPSGTQSTPSASPPPPAPKQKQKQASQSSRALPPPRAPNGGLAAAARLAQRALTQEAPASSQATLIGPVPSQMRGASGAAKLPPRRPREASIEREEAHAPTEKPVAKRRKIHKAPEPPVVQVPPMREGGRGSRVASQAARKTADQPRKAPSVVPAPRRQPVRPPSPVVQEEDEDEDGEDQDDFEMEDEGVVAGGSDEQDVEELLQARSAETSRQFTPPVAGPSGASASDDMDSDDQIALQKLNPDRRASMSDEDDDDVAYANSLDLTVPSRSRNVSAHHATASRSPQVPVTPVRPVRRGTDASTESEAAVPLAGTRASETVRRARESAKREPYLPPPGTRAAIVAAIPAPISGKVLRSRKIPTRA